MKSGRRGAIDAESEDVEPAYPAGVLTELNGQEHGTRRHV